MKLAIIGSRDFSDYVLVQKIMQDRYCVFSDYNTDAPTGYHTILTEIISGGARGADSFARRWAEEYNKTVNKIYQVKMTEFIPDWNLYGKGAGFLRNTQIIEAADEVLCFWDGVSRGTADSLSKAKKLKKNTLIIYF